jgi:hypothetical protein
LDDIVIHPIARGKATGRLVKARHLVYADRIATSRAHDKDGKAMPALRNPHRTDYTVEKGESLWSIATAQYGDGFFWREIAAANQLKSPGLILVGQHLRLPNIVSYRPGPASREAYFAPAGPHGGDPHPAANTHTGPLGRHPASVVRDGANRADLTRPAREVLFPAIKYNLDTAQPIVISTPAADFKLQFTGSLTLEREGTVAELEVQGSGGSAVSFKSPYKTSTGAAASVEVERDHAGEISLTAKSEYDSKFSKLVGKVDIKFNPKEKQVEVQCGLSIALKRDGKVLATTDYAFSPPNKFIFTYTPAPIKGEYEGFEADGTVGYKLEVTVKKPSSQTDILMSAAEYTAAAVIVLAAAAILVGEGAKDVVQPETAVTAPLSWSAAMALLLQAQQIVQ